MKKIKTFFTEQNMTWCKVLIFAVVTAVYTALINQVSFLAGTSFRDIAINLECWILFAVFIIVNCKKWWEASLKCFVFFLVSQPLIYLIEVPFSSMGFGLFSYYKYWAILTVLTLPGAVAAYQLRRKDWLSVAVLSVANGFLAYTAVRYLKSAWGDFPHHLLSGIFCVALILFFVFVLLDNKKHRLAALLLAAAVLVGSAVFLLRDISVEIPLDAGDWTCTLEDDTVAEVQQSEDGDSVKVIARHDGCTFLHLQKEDGTYITYCVTVSGGGVFLNTMDE